VFDPREVGTCQKTLSPKPLAEKASLKNSIANWQWYPHDP
jgi:hypothetical protein